jgi:hypothetical protein
MHRAVIHPCPALTAHAGAPLPNRDVAGAGASCRALVAHEGLCHGCVDRTAAAAVGGAWWAGDTGEVAEEHIEHKGHLVVAHPTS